MTPTLALVTVVNGSAYEEYAAALFESARNHFRPAGVNVEYLMLHGREGWPAATMYRWHTLLESLPRAQLVFLVDADMLFAEDCGDEAVPPEGYGIVATQHPGYVGKPEAELPYERRPESACCVPQGKGGAYYCGGFVGGERLAVRILAAWIARRLDSDLSRGLTPRWHDESALNSVLAEYPPTVTLSPAWCHPDQDDWYRSFWPENYPRYLVALDKTQAERGNR